MIQEIKKGGFLVEVKNQKGTKADVVIAETLEGFTARYKNSRRKIKTTKSNPENLARKLAKSGHKSVKILD